MAGTDTYTHARALPLPEEGAADGQAQNHRIRRLTIAGLCTLGVADSLYMLAFTEGLIDSMACPFFGEGCEIVGRSEHAKHFGVPNSAVGAVGYAAMAALALWGARKQPDEKPWQPLALAGLATASLGVSAYLTYEQAAKVRAWCFWCLSSAAINVAVWGLSLPEASEGWEERHGVSHPPSRGR